MVVVVLLKLITLRVILSSSLHNVQESKCESHVRTLG